MQKIVKKKKTKPETENWKHINIQNELEFATTKFLFKKYKKNLSTHFFAITK